MHVIKIITYIVSTLLLATTTMAQPTQYNLVKDRSEANFTYQLENTPVTGRMPISKADITIDFNNMRNSKVSATLNARKISAGMIFATDAIKSKTMLNTDAHPTITFQSTSITGQIPNGQVRGNLTMNNKTRPIVLSAEIFRAKGTRTGDLSRLTVILTGQINRNDFGVSGYKALVAPTIKLRLKAEITRQ